MLKENILVKDELLNRVKNESINLPSKRKEETRELQNKLKKYWVLHIKMKEESIGLPMIKNHQDENTIVTTLALGSWPRQGLTKVHAKSEARESHFMLPGV